MTEIKSWDSIPASRQNNDELFRETLPTEEARAAFNMHMINISPANVLIKFTRK